jgi:hypothetical protein
MGEIADAMAHGEMCSQCGTYFKKEHGYPVLCKSCWKDATPEDRKAHQKAIHPEI